MLFIDYELPTSDSIKLLFDSEIDSININTSFIIIQDSSNTIPFTYEVSLDKLSIVFYLNGYSFVENNVVRVAAIIPGIDHTIVLAEFDFSIVRILRAEIRSSTRIRLYYTSNLNSYAFRDVSKYTLVSTNAGTNLPSFIAEYAVPAEGNAVELILNSDLSKDCSYDVIVNNLSYFENSTTYRCISNSFVSVYNGSVKKRPSIGNDDLLEELYGVDLIWDGEDLVETFGGDLASITGDEMVKNAIVRRLLSNGLPWDKNYGAMTRKYVDGTRFALSSLRSNLLNQCLSDNRVVSAEAVLLPEESGNLSDATFEINIKLISGDIVSVNTPIKVG